MSNLSGGTGGDPFDTAPPTEPVKAPAPTCREALADTCSRLATRLQWRINDCRERAGSDKEAITGSGFAMGYLFAGDIHRALEESAAALAAPDRLPPDVVQVMAESTAFIDSLKEHFGWAADIADRLRAVLKAHGGER